MHESAEQLVSRARERFALQDYYGAVHLLEEVAAGGRAFADAYHLLGLSLSLLGQPAAALAEFDRALGLDPRYLEALIHRGLVLLELGRTAEAEESFRRAGAASGGTVAGLPAATAARLANQHASLGDAYAEAGALAEAVTQYRRALELGPAFHDLRYKLARLLLEANRPLEAREQLELVLRARPNFVDAQAALGLARYLSGDAAGAREVWTACLRRRPEDARVEAYLAMMERSRR
jgi:tetratricopeptide (TPR) repeat protein